MQGVTNFLYISQFSCSHSQDDFPVLAISADGHHKRNHACLKATQLPGSPIQHFTNHYSVTFIVLKYWPRPVSHASPPKPSRLLAVCFSVEIQRGYEAKRFSLKKNGTRLVRVSPHSLLDHCVLLRSRYNSSLKPKLTALLTTGFAQFSFDIWESMASTPIEDCRNLT